jgi:hypothetical protein
MLLTAKLPLYICGVKRNEPETNANKMNTTPKQAALNYIYSYSNVGIFKIPPRVDKRTTFGKQMMREIKANQITPAEMDRIEKMRFQRRMLRKAPAFVNVFEISLVKDLIQNRSNITFIADGKICFYGRNRYFSGSKETKIVSIFS